jgi:pimeloyl-ACP methyl ester carboxylesterase
LSILLLAALCGAGLGCATQQYVTLRAEPHTPLAVPLQLYARSGPKPSRWTVQFLRQHDLLNKERVSTRWAVGDVARIHRERPSAASCYALAELSYIAGRSAELQNREQAQGHYWDSIVHSYEYLFDPKYARIRTPYDPQFRSTCDLYNGSLESWMRLAQKAGTLKVGQTIAVRTKHQQADAAVVSLGSVWKAEDFERFEFVSDYEVTGLENLHVHHGLGVPLIAVRRAGTAAAEVEKYYAKGLSFPVTALLRPVGPRSDKDRPSPYLLELYDPNEKPEVLVGRHHVPLESDITTPLAYFLNNPSFQRIDTYGLLFPQRLSKVSGLYMVQPYQPGKIPVVMIHGLWSSPMTWMQAFNDLQSYPEIREHYQFWFYLYPTGQAFPESAAALRRDLAEVRRTFGGAKSDAELNQMVLVGHSMGGLIARSLAIEGPDSVNAVKRVVTIAAPFRGSDDSNKFTRWLARQVIRVPNDTLAATRRFLLPGAAGAPKPDLDGLTSIDSLSPNSPILQALLERRPLHRIVFNNIIGVIEGTPPKTGTDGVVTYASAHLDDDVESELVVPADHLHVNEHPRTILELRRILDVHLKEQGIDTGPALQLLDGSAAGDEPEDRPRLANQPG